MSPPSEPVVVPTAVVAATAGRAVEPVWVNERGGVTFALDGGRAYLKWTPHGRGLPALDDEIERLTWARPWTPVPEVLDRGGDHEGDWMVTAALPGAGAVTGRWRSEPAVAVAAIGAGLRGLHDALPVDLCPFSWSVETRLGRAGRPPGVLGTVPPVDRLVVCHGDACAPNTIVGPDGRCSGHVDLGTLGVADRWADLAVATWSTGWNFGPGWQDLLLDAYGVERDDERIAFYRLLWDATPTG